MLRLFNSLIRAVEPFKPIKSGRVGIYTCGPTVYNYAHIGNLRTYVFEDILKRVLKYNGYKIRHVMNITDVGHLTTDADEGEDKMEKGAKREGKSAREIAKFYAKTFKQDLKDLNIKEPDKWCEATKHIKEQIALIKKLETKGFTYATSDGIYFDTSKFPNYGQLANLQNQKLQAGARVELGEKKNHTDFALWKKSPAGQKRQMEWPSPWGVGFPGWHIECSAMSVKYLGQPFDIHCGGIDHIPVHHTNEIAQSEAAEGKPLANYWLHGEFLLVGEGKMAKSEGNFLTLRILKEKGINPLAYRYFLLQAHYRKQLNFTWEALAAANEGLKHLYREINKLRIKNDELKNNETKNKFLEYINNDLDLPGALAYLWTAISNKQINQSTIYWVDEILGLKIKEAVKALRKPAPRAVLKLAAQRQTARQNQDFKRADELRQKINALGYEVEDAADGPRVVKSDS